MAWIHPRHPAWRGGHEGRGSVPVTAPSAGGADAPEAGRADPFSALGAVLLVVVGAVAFAAFLVLGAFAPDGKQDLRGASALSPGAVGFAGLVELLRAAGIETRISRVAERTPRAGLLVLTPPPGTAIGPELLAERDGATLVVLPKWRVTPLAGHPGWVESRGLLATGEVETMMRGSALPSAVVLRRDGVPAALHGGTGRLETVRALPVGIAGPVQSLSVSADWTPVLLDALGDAVLLRPTGRATYVLADPDVLDTRGLKGLDAAAGALALVDALREGGPVTFDVTLDGFGEPPSLLRLLFEPPLLGATLCGAAAAALILAMALHRFGPTQESDSAHDLGKRALADNSAALIALARREPRMAMPYAGLMRSMALRDLGAPARRGAGALDEALDAASRARGLADDWTGLAARAAGVRSRADLLRVAERLHRWRTGMTRDPR